MGWYAFSLVAKFCQLVNLSTEQGSTEFRTPLCVILATPL